jgi:RimJ/RimL family protein N-acetyltransferase
MPLDVTGPADFLPTNRRPNAILRRRCLTGLVEMKTSRLLLRPWRPKVVADVRCAYDIYRRMEVVRWLGTQAKPWPSLDATRERLARWSGIGSERPGYGMWAVVPESVGWPVGTVLLVPLPDADGRLTDGFEIGWHFHPDSWGHGYATEASAAVLDHAFHRLGLPRVNALAYPDNAASFGVMKRLGMTPRGTSDRWYGQTFDWWVAESAHP